MLVRLKETTIAGLGFALVACAGVALAAMPLRMDGFGPPVQDDSSLNTGLGVLAQQVAWLNSPAGDVFQLATEKMPETTFADASPAFPSVVALNYGIPIGDDMSLNANMGAVSELIARLNGPDGREFSIAQSASSNDADFTRVAVASIAKSGSEPDLQ